MESIIPQEQKEALMEAELLVNNNPQILVEGEFLDGQEVTNEKNLLENILCTILEKAIEGIPGYIESTESRCARYLSENQGDPYKAFQASKEKNFSFRARIYRAIFESIPIIGIPVALTYPIWKLMRALCLLAALHDHNVNSEEVQKQILLCFSSASSSTDAALQSTKPIAVQAVTTATKSAVLPEVTTVLANRAAANYIATGVQFVSTQGSEVALETAGSILAGKYGGMATKYIATKSGLTEALNGITTSIGNQIINKGLPNAVTQKLATNSIVQTSVSRSAAIGATAITGAIIIPLNLFLGWILDNSEEIFKNARLQFIPQASAEELISSFEIIGIGEENDDESFQFIGSIRLKFLQALPEQESGQGYLFSWYKLETPNSISNSNFYIQHWGLIRSAYRIVCKHFRPNIILPLVSCESLEDAEYVLSFLQKLESDLIYSDFLSKLNQNELYLQDLIFPDKNQKI